MVLYADSPIESPKGREVEPPFGFEYETPDQDMVMLGREQDRDSNSEAPKPKLLVFGSKMYFGVTGVAIGCCLGLLIAFIVDRATKTPALESPTSVPQVYKQLTLEFTTLQARCKIAKWVGLLGTQFIRALQAISTLFIFFAVAEGVAHFRTINKARSVCLRFILFSAFTLSLASLEGYFFMAAVPSHLIAPSPSQNSNIVFLPPSVPAPVIIQCPRINETDLFLGYNESTKRMTCSKGVQSVIMSSVPLPSRIVMRGETSPADQIYIFIVNLVPNSLVGTFAVADSFMSVTTVAVILGLVMGSLETKQIKTFIREIHLIFLVMVEYASYIVPIAVMSLVASSTIVPDINGIDNIHLPPLEKFQGLGNETAIMNAIEFYKKNARISSSTVFENLVNESRLALVLLVVFFIGVVIHSLIIMPILTYICIRRSPFVVTANLVKAILFGFGSASSLAALPITIDATVSDRIASNHLAQSVLSVGSVLHLDGAAFYLSACATFLVRAQGIVFSGNQMFMLIITSVIYSWSCPPLPHGALGPLLLVLSFVVQDGKAIAFFVWVLAMDILLDRLSTLMSVWSNILLLKIIAKQTNDKEEDDLLNEIHLYSESGLQGPRPIPNVRDSDEFLSPMSPIRHRF